MFSKRLKWYYLAENKAELTAWFAYRNTLVHKTLFGEVLLVKEEKEFLAFKNQCPHQNKSLVDCKVIDGYIICPFHQYHFSLQNGRGHGLYLDSYPIQFREDESVWIGKERWTFL